MLELNNLIGFGAGGSEFPPVTTYATWNSADKAGGITLSGGDLGATNVSGGLVRSTYGKSSGKWYWEVTYAPISAGAIGIATSSANLASYPGSDLYGWSYTYTGDIYSNALVLDSSPATYTAGAIIGIALDAAAGTVQWYKNGVLQTTTTSLTGTFFAAVGAGGAVGGATPTFTANFGASAFTYSPPSGYAPGLYI